MKTKLMMIRMIKMILQILLSKNDRDGFHRGVVLKGCSGTWKSTAINAIQLNLLKSNEVIIPATTRKAATMIGGSTVYSLKGRLVLLLDSAYKPLNETNLRELQNLY